MKEYPPDSNNPLLEDEKSYIISSVSRITEMNISSINKIVYTRGAPFGNNILSFNKIIFFCEILKCNEIAVINKNFWFLKNNMSMILNGRNISINIIEKLEYNISSNGENRGYLVSDTLYCTSLWPLFYSYKIKSKIRIHKLRDEIINNLPKVNISKNDLYIHIRSGDIFSTWIHRPYAQPPLCFYTSIIKNFVFRKIYIISENNKNPIVDKLTNKFRNIIYSKNDLKYDMSFLINSYNLVCSISSFAISTIIFNANLENVFEYNLYPMNQKILHYHYDLFEFYYKFTIYRMEPSSNYKNKMFSWKNNKMQRKLMMKEKCINDFIISRN